MRVAPGKQACASRRAHRGDVEIRIPHPTSRQPVHTRGGNFGSVAAEVGKTHVVENDDYDIGRPFGGGQLVRPPGLGILICRSDRAFEEIFVMRHAASLLEAAHIASAAHRRSTAQVHAACSRVPITSRTSNRAIQVSCCVNVAHMDRPKFFSPACWIPCGRSHSAAIFAALISAAHLSISLWINSWRYSGDLRSGATKTEPNSFRRSSVAGALIAATVALWSFCTIAAGVPLGKTKENQAPASKLATPCSCADSRFGRVGERFFVRTAIAFTELPWMCGIASSAAGH